MTNDAKFEPGERNVVTLAQATNPETTFVNAKLSDLNMLAKGAGSTYVNNDGFTLTDHSYPTTRAGQVQEFIDGFGHLGKLYSDSVNDPARFEKFQQRMQGVYQYDRETFKDLGALGEKLIANPPISGEQVGKELADIIKRTADRKGSDFTSADWQNLQAAVAGVMIAAGSTFDLATKAAKNIAMVDAMENQLKSNGINNLHAIIWGDTKEPGMAITPNGKTLTPEQRHNFL